LHPQSERRSLQNWHKKKQKKICEIKEKDSIFAHPNREEIRESAKQKTFSKSSEKKIKKFSKPLPDKKEVVHLHPLTETTIRRKRKNKKTRS
jgi:hypothetical protein